MRSSAMPHEWARLPKNCVRRVKRRSRRGIEISEAYVRGSRGFGGGEFVIVPSYWEDRAPRDLIRQVARPRPRGTAFLALRRPASEPLAMGSLGHLCSDNTSA